MGRHRRAAGRAAGCTTSAPPSRTHRRRGRARGADYGIVEDYVGHGIGTEMHQDPQVPNYRRARPRARRSGPGSPCAIEPMVTLGSAETRVLADDWTVVTDGRHAGRALGALGRRHRGRACGSSPPSTVAGERLEALGAPYAPAVLSLGRRISVRRGRR